MPSLTRSGRSRNCEQFPRKPERIVIKMAMALSLRSAASTISLTNAAASSETPGSGWKTEQFLELVHDDEEVLARRELAVLPPVPRLGCRPGVAYAGRSGGASRFAGAPYSVPRDAGLPEALRQWLRGPTQALRHLLRSQSRARLNQPAALGASFAVTRIAGPTIRRASFCVVDGSRVDATGRRTV
jgi:hypothetical protein